MDVTNAECGSTVYGNISMEMGKIEQVIVGGEAEIRAKPVIAPSHPYQLESLQCFECLITFSNLKAKERHYKTNHRKQYTQHLQQINTVFSCFKCDKCFHSSEELNQHQVSHNTEKKPFHCKACKKRFCAFSELNKHQRYECTERRFSCKDCAALFPSGFRLRLHSMTVHRNRTVATEDCNTFQCCKCGHGFQTEQKLLEHQEQFASSQFCNLNPREGEPERKRAQVREVEAKKTRGCREGSSTAELKIPCPKPDCDRTFPSVAALRVHKKDKHGPLPCKAPSSEHTCPTCGKNFARESALKSHQTSHAKRKVSDKR